MILRQFLHTDPAGVSYLFGCHNEALLIEYEGAFIRFMLAEIPPVPPKAAALRAANSGLAAAAA
ncbi:MAG: hypothetical protein E5V72_10725 [Mesorhizobium sp.]|uniref:hypothetical protein n=1 Tax=Mesorhizobium sp. TaxID=1871066 RepID=UPI000FE53D81|nr:hypothetical protein [Mesorhizobium sp.]RWC47045.1 MAG: hypothetical protein EOS28_01265 [Mesorhizobium sp.]RWF00274.1 MAG: hypothetical protein EOS68_10085 [Mesorhizobium sp.]TIW46917.1 MAG: hypothetical protein E5V72_10725 [Mesorhizobium sp.]TIX57736.1 MAG: hypothetical protein E5V28_14120 [Mesorhizobium sp.]